MTQLEEYQIREIEDTLRLVSNTFNSPKRETCLDRMVMQCWNWVIDALNDISTEEMSKNNIYYRMKVGQIPQLKD